MADFQTPLPIHKAAFPRIGGRLTMPAAAIERLRRAFQAAERRGLPAREIEEAINRVVGEEDWQWPWFEAGRVVIASTFTLPLGWQQDGIPLTTEWDRIPHAKKVRFLSGALFSALYVERELTSWRDIKRDWPTARLELKVSDERCPTSKAVHRQHAALIRAGDLRFLPPFFPGDTCHLQIDPLAR